MDLTKRVLVRFPGTSRVSGPYDIEGILQSADAMFHFEGESEWRPMQELIDAIDAQPATKVQRQRLRKHGVQFDENTVTRRQARELYRETPLRKEKQAQRDTARAVRDQAEREQLMAEVTARGFSVKPDIPLQELQDLSYAEPAPAEMIDEMEAKIARVQSEGMEVKRPTEPFTRDACESLLSLLTDYLEASETGSLVECFHELAEIECLSREPTLEELEVFKKILFRTIIAGEWDDTTQALAKMLSSVAHDILYTDEPGGCTPIPAHTDSRASFRVWNSDGTHYYSVVVTRALGEVTFGCDCEGGRRGKPCKHQKGIFAGDAAVLWDRRQAQLLVQVRRWWNPKA